MAEESKTPVEEEKEDHRKTLNLPTITNLNMINLGKQTTRPSCRSQFGCFEEAFRIGSEQYRIGN